VIELAGRVALVWLGTVALVYAYALIRQRRLPANYHEACEVWGLCCWWPLTFALEVLLAWHDRKTRQATPKE
jgi:hypothetical protein